MKALALKLDFKTTRQANEKALRSMFQYQCSLTDIKQNLQARAALYGDLLEPSWFTRNTDLGGKTKNLKQRRSARSMLLGAVLLVAQMGAHQLRHLLTSGKSGMLNGMALHATGSAAYFKKALQQAPMIEVLQ